MKKKKRYPEGSVAHLISKDVPIAKSSFTVAEIKELLDVNINIFSTINYIYIIDEAEKLIGAISIKDLYGSHKSIAAKDLLSAELISVSPGTDKEKVAMLALEKSLKAVPVVDERGFLLGIVSSDDILKILHDESVENLLKLSGVSQKEPYNVNIFSISLPRSLKNRLPWLIVGLLGGLFVAFVVSFFEGVLNKNIILAAFIPLIVYMSDAVCSQMQAFIIRDLALSESINFLKYTIRHARVVFFIGLIISGLLYLLVLLFYGDSLIALVLSISLFFATITSILTGLVVPFVFHKLKMDPANASGPIATILQDILSVFVYLLTAYILL
jgi:magnesium transporter